MKTTWIIATAILALVFPKSYKVAPMPVQEIKTPPRAILSQTAPRILVSTNSIYAYVVKESKIYGIPVASTTFIVSHESQWDTQKIGDDGLCQDPKSPNYGKETTSNGLWQINSCYHPEVPISCSLDPTGRCSTLWSIRLIVAGGINQWSTYRLCKKLYGVCPE